MKLRLQDATRNAAYYVHPLVWTWCLSAIPLESNIDMAAYTMLYVWVNLFKSFNEFPEIRRRVQHSARDACVLSAEEARWRHYCELKVDYHLSAVAFQLSNSFRLSSGIILFLLFYFTTRKDTVWWHNKLQKEFNIKAETGTLSRDCWSRKWS